MSDEYDPELDGEPPPKKGAAPSPNAVAEEIMAETRFVQDSTGTVYRYTGTHWIEAPEPYLIARALAEDGPRRSSARRRGEIVSFIKARSHVPDLAWGRVGDNEVALANGVINVETGVMRSHDADDMLERVIPWPYRKGSPCPLWLQVLDMLLGAEGTDGRREALQEFFGYVLLSHAHYKKALILFGPSDTGKSLILEILRRLVGIDRICTLGVEEMDDPLLRAQLVGKALNVLSEVPEAALIKDGAFKTLVSTEEPITVNPKYKPAFAYVSTAKHVIACNDLPRVNDRTLATFNRLLIVPLTRVLAKEEQDPTLAGRIGAEEMPGVVRWALAGARRLWQNGGRFTEPEISKSLVERYREDENPFFAFAADRLVRSGGRATPLEAVRSAFNAWAGSRYTTKRVGGFARAAGFEIGKVRHGSRVLSSLMGWELGSAATIDRVDLTGEQDAEGTWRTREDRPGEPPF